MQAHMSWVEGSGSYTWFVYLMLRFAWKISVDDISSWQQEIKNALGTMFLPPRYWLSIMLLNLTFASLAIFLLSMNTL